MSKLYHLQWLFWNITLIQFISECVPVIVPCLFPAPDAREYILDEAHRPQNKYKDISLPTSLDWRWYKNNTYTSPVKNSLVQNYCGACWAFSTTSTLTDRINIQNGHQFPEWSLSAQTLLDCAANLPNNGCKGGNPILAYEYIRHNGIATDACSPYRAVGRDTNAKACTASSKCMQCSAHNRCGAQYPYKAWKIVEHGVVEGELNMIFALQDGPIVCGMAVTQDFELLNNFNVYKDSSNDKNATLAVSIVGYGSTSDGTDGSQYWIGRNSWGDYWGNHGYFRIIRGINNLGIESKCYWAIPESEPFVVNGSNQTNVDREIRDTLETKIKFDFISAYPAEFSWNNVNGTSYITAVRNQNVPNYCLSDWAFAVTSMMSDRLNVNRAAVNHQSAWPEIIFSVQSLLNVGGDDINANCYGCGDLHSVMKYISAHSVPVESCQLYIGNDASATALHQCEYCNNAANPKMCASISNFTAYSFSKWGSITGENDMKQAIYSSGPIVCGMDATPQFKQYTTGIYQQFLFTVTINHYVEIIGWGFEVAPNNVTLEPYWIGKNSWGTYWGEMGLFRIQMKTNNLGIETFCFYGDPQLKK